MSDTFDAVVIGHGAAGLSAALAFVEAKPGASVVVLERSSREMSGGATRWTTSRIRVNDQGVVDPIAIEIVLNSDENANEPYLRTLEREAAKTLETVVRHGVDIQHGSTGFATESKFDNEAAPAGGGKEFVEKLGQACVDRGVNFRYETEAVSLVADGEGRVTGVVIRDASGEHTLNAGAVVIACGGFEGNYEMLAKHLGPRVTELAPIAPGVSNNRGDGITMATALGAATAGDFEMIHAEPVDKRTQHPDAIVFGTPYCIVVNARGERFIDEGGRTFEALFEPLAFEIWKNQGNEAYIVWDKKTSDMPYFHFLNTSDLPPVESDTLEGLASALGLEGAGLINTVAEFNAAVQDGEFDPTRPDGKSTAGLAFDKTNWAMTLDTPPYYGYPVKSSITFTFGGIDTDERARVRRADGSVIPGLYAAGEVTGIFYGEYPVGLSVLRSLTFGRIAGEEAAISR